MSWTTICPADRVRPERGVAAIVDEHPVAIFRLPALDDGDDLWFCVDHIDPVTGSPVIARGLVGSSGVANEPMVASPLYKERYSLVTGKGIDDPERSIGAHGCRVNDDGMVEVQLVTSS